MCIRDRSPRCVAFLVMMGYWLLHALIDWNDVEGVREDRKQRLRQHVLDGGPIDLVALGLDSRDALLEYCQNEENEMPFLGENSYDAVMEMRALLEDAGKDLKEIPEGYDDLHLIPVLKQEIKGPDAETSEKVSQAVAKRSWGPKDKAEAKRLKFKMGRYKRYVEKKKGWSCAVM
eukprot:TRINITY_DN7077_c0_g1_i2.p2 TRINITY_DN7077_c0_g1~~TRINITY_DN7077_c0_g1_i2.p2  ORF type:complete len:175 (-),score=63.87 TRINITY_DN7077_c0_g1_i2:236-760(-)